VRDVLGLLRAGHSFETIIVDYDPGLEEADIRACLQFAMDVIEAKPIGGSGVSS